MHEVSLFLSEKTKIQRNLQILIEFRLEGEGWHKRRLEADAFFMFVALQD